MSVQLQRVLLKFDCPLRPWKLYIRTGGPGNPVPLVTHVTGACPLPRACRSRLQLTVRGLALSYTAPASDGPFAESPQC